MTGRMAPWAVTAVVVIGVIAGAGKVFLAHRALDSRSKALAQLSASAALDAVAANARSAQVRVLDSASTSLLLAVTLPGGEVVDESIKLEPGVGYPPTPEELAGQPRADAQVVGASLHEAIGPAGKQLVLHYLVPTDALSAEMREHLYGKPSATAGLHFFSSAWAQPAISLWTGVQTGMSTGKYLSGLQPSVPYWAKLKGNYDKVAHAMDTADQFSQWMRQLDAMEACARNPTHTVTKNAYQQNPQYQQQTIAAIEEARSSVKQATGLSYVNQEAGTSMQLTGAPALLSGMTGKVSAWNDSALTDIANGIVVDAAKLVDCNLAPPPERRDGDGTIEYHMHREGYVDFDMEDRIVKANVYLHPGPAPGIATMSGQGQFQAQTSAKRVGTSSKCAGTSSIQGGGGSQNFKIGGAPSAGACEFNNRGKVSELSYSESDTGFTCEFRNLDLVNGGRYEVQADGYEAQFATCALELKPQRH
jgi:hypothetical protein